MPKVPTDCSHLVELHVTIWVTTAESDGVVDLRAAEESVQQAVQHALQQAEGEGFTHELSAELALNAYRVVLWDKAPVTTADYRQGYFRMLAEPPMRSYLPRSAFRLCSILTAEWQSFATIWAAVQQADLLARRHPLTGLKFSHSEDEIAGALPELVRSGFVLVGWKLEPTPDIGELNCHILFNQLQVTDIPADQLTALSSAVLSWSREDMLAAMLWARSVHLAANHANPIIVPDPPAVLVPFLRPQGSV